MTAEEEKPRSSREHLDLAPRLVKQGRGLESTLTSSEDGNAAARQRREIAVVRAVARVFRRQVIELLGSRSKWGDPGSYHDLRGSRRLAVREGDQKSAVCRSIRATVRGSTVEATCRCTQRP